MSGDRADQVRAKTEAPSSIEQEIDGIDELIGVIRFGEKEVGFLRGVAEDILVHSTAEQEDFLIGPQFAASVDELHAVHGVHRVVGEQNIRRVFRVGVSFEGAAGIAKSLNGMSERTEDDGSQLEKHGFVIDDEKQSVAVITGVWGGLIFRTGRH